MLGENINNLLVYFLHGSVTQDPSQLAQGDIPYSDLGMRTSQITKKGPSPRQRILIALDHGVPMSFVLLDRSLGTLRRWVRVGRSAWGMFLRVIEYVLWESWCRNISCLMLSDQY